MRNLFKEIVWKRFIPLFVLLVLMIVGYATGIYEYLTIETLKEKQFEIKTFVREHSFIAPLIFILMYTICKALSFPGATILSLVGGFLFPIPLSTLYVVTGATLGSSVMFFAARTALGEVLRHKAGPFFKKMEQGFQKNAWSYLLFLRFVPLFPFWLVNVAAAFFQVRFPTFLWTTFVGIIPGSYAYTQLGAGMGAILESKEPLSFSGVFNVQMVISLIALGVLILASFLIKKFVLKKKEN